MPVIFNTPTSQRVIMFDKDAAFMLKAMKTSGNIPGALFPEAVSEALEALKTRIDLENNAENTDTEQSNSNDDDNDHIGLNTKALPLIELMEKALAQNEKLLWDHG